MRGLDCETKAGPRPALKASWCCRWQEPRASSIPATLFLVGPGLDAGLRCLPPLTCGTGRLGLGLALLVVTEDAAPKGTLKSPRDKGRGPGGQLCAWAPSSVSSQPLLPWGSGPARRCGSESWCEFRSACECRCGCRCGCECEFRCGCGCRCVCSCGCECRCVYRCPELSGPLVPTAPPSLLRQGRPSSL